MRDAWWGSGWTSLNIFEEFEGMLDVELGRSLYDGEMGLGLGILFGNHPPMTDRHYYKHYLFATLSVKSPWRHWNTWRAPHPAVTHVHGLLSWIIEATQSTVVRRFGGFTSWWVGEWSVRQSKEASSKTGLLVSGYINHIHMEKWGNGTSGILFPGMCLFCKAI